MSLFDAKITVEAKSLHIPLFNLLIKFAVVGKTKIISAHLDNDI